MRRNNIITTVEYMLEESKDNEVIDNNIPPTPSELGGRILGGRINRRYIMSIFNRQSNEIPAVRGQAGLEDCLDYSNVLRIRDFNETNRNRFIDNIRNQQNNLVVESEENILNRLQTYSNSETNNTLLSIVMSDINNNQLISFLNAVSCEDINFLANNLNRIMNMFFYNTQTELDSEEILRLNGMHFNISEIIKIIKLSICDNTIIENNDILNNSISNIEYTQERLENIMEGSPNTINRLEEINTQNQEALRNIRFRRYQILGGAVSSMIISAGLSALLAQAGVIPPIGTIFRMIGETVSPTSTEIVETNNNRTNDIRLRDLYDKILLLLFKKIK